MAVSVVCDLRLILVLPCLLWASTSAQEQDVKPVRLAHTCIRFCSGVSSEDDLSPVIMLHGIFDCRDTWRWIYQIIARETHREVCILDARNHGDSPGSDDFNFDIMIKDLNFFLEEKNISKAILVGHHMGGVAAMQLALTKPEKVEKIIIEDFAPWSFNDTRENMGIEIQLMNESLTAIPEGVDLQTAKKALHASLQETLPAIYKEEGFQTDEEVDTIPLKFENGVYKWNLNFDGILAGFNNSNPFMKPYSGIYNGDALFIYGTTSPVKVNNAKDLILKFFPKAQLIGVQGASHWIHTRFPEFLTEVLKFINVDEEM